MPTTRKVVATDKAPSAIGPYSQGIASCELVFTAGQIPVDPATGKIDAETVESQTHQALKNLRAVLQAGGSDLDNVLKVTVFMTDLGKFGEMNAVYGQYFNNEPPARSAVEVSALPLGAQVEIECVALRRVATTSPQ